MSEAPSTKQLFAFERIAKQNGIGCLSAIGVGKKYIIILDPIITIHIFLFIEQGRDCDNTGDLYRAVTSCSCRREGAEQVFTGHTTGNISYGRFHNQ